MPYSATGAGTCDAGLVWPHLRQVVIDDVREEGAGLVVVARTRNRRVRCPGCGVVSGRVHSRYRRRLEDVAVAGRPVVVQLRVRRMVCDAPACAKATFAEQVPGLTRPHQRRTHAVRAVLERLALALTGRAGARLAAVLGMPVSRSTLVRLIRALPDPPIGPVVVLGVDEFARRRGHIYATVLMDMATHRVIDVLDGRRAAPLADWLKHHPGIRVICRDRAGAYAQAACTGAPQAIQVADRWHLWHSLAKHLTATIRRHRVALTKPSPLTDPAVPPPDPLEPIFVHPASRLADHADYLRTRWLQGCHNARQLARELAPHGYTGSAKTISRHLHKLAAAYPPPPPPPKPPKLRQVTGWIMRPPHKLTPDQQEELAGIRARCPQIDAAVTHVADFADILTTGRPNRIQPWITAIDPDALPDLHTFAQSLRNDIDAVTNALALTHNSGPVEGHINKIKYIKRQMYGRANLDLLRARILHDHHEN